jgi:hypothetical protein
MEETEGNAGQGSRKRKGYDATWWIQELQAQEEKIDDLRLFMADLIDMGPGSIEGVGYWFVHFVVHH